VSFLVRRRSSSVRRSGFLVRRRSLFVTKRVSS
jgi:hypothetical protein